MTAPQNTFWHDWRTEILKTKFADGWSAGRIAEELGCTRNTVVGKLARLGLHRAAKPAAPRPPRAQPRPPFSPKFEPPHQVTEALPTTSADDAAIPLDQLKAVVDLEAGDCRWPITLPSGEHRFCPGRKEDSRPYCAAHSRRAYNPGAYRNALRPFVPARTAK